jgi:hypothetical protein
VATATTRRLAAVGMAGTALLSGCAGLQEDDVARVAGVFEDPAAAPADRCALLAPATLEMLESDESAPCADAIGQVPLRGRGGGGLGPRRAGPAQR